MSWPKQPVAELCEFAIDCVNKTAPTVDHETPYKMIRTTNIKNGFIDLNQVKYVSKEVFLKWTRRSKPKYGDVILTREAPVGEIGRYTSSDENVLLGQRLFHYRPNPQKLDWNFLAYVLMSPQVQGYLKGIGFGATVDHIKVGDAENLEIPCPPIEMQKCIGNILSNYDSLIENNKRRIQLLEDFARLLYEEWFVRLRFPGYEGVKIEGGLPKGWKHKTFGEICSVLKKTILPENISPKTPYIGLEHMPRRSITLSEWGDAADVTSTKFKFNPGNILFGKIRPYFHKVGIALTEGITSSDMIVLEASSPRELPFTLLTASSDSFVAIVSKTVKEGSKMPRADIKVMEAHQIRYPSDEILQKFDRIVEPILLELKVLSFQMKKLAQARDLLLPRLMNGEIAV